MLAFQGPPEPVFLEILHAALDDWRERIKWFAEEDGDPEEWSSWLPLLARCFSPRSAVDVIDKLLTASREETVYELTDYHWLVVYVCLDGFVDTHNFVAGGRPDKLCDVGPYSIGPIDLDALVERFFWDIDFLVDEGLLHLTAEERERRLYGPEAFGLAAGLAPHPDELVLSIWEGKPPWAGEEMFTFAESGSVPLYPPPDDEAGAST